MDCVVQSNYAVPTLWVQMDLDFLHRPGFKKKKKMYINYGSKMTHDVGTVLSKATYYYEVYLSKQV